MVLNKNDFPIVYFEVMNIWDEMRHSSSCWKFNMRNFKKIDDQIKFVCCLSSESNIREKMNKRKNQFAFQKQRPSLRAGYTDVS